MRLAHFCSVAPKTFVLQQYYNLTVFLTFGAVEQHANKIFEHVLHSRYCSYALFWLLLSIT